METTEVSGVQKIEKKGVTHISMWTLLWTMPSAEEDRRIFVDIEKSADGKLARSPFPRNTEGKPKIPEEHGVPYHSNTL